MDSVLEYSCKSEGKKALTLNFLESLKLIMWKIGLESLPFSIKSYFMNNIMGWLAYPLPMTYTF